MTHEEFVRTCQAENLRLLEKAKVKGQKTIGVLGKDLEVTEQPIEVAEADIEKTAQYLSRKNN